MVEKTPEPIYLDPPVLARRRGVGKPPMKIAKYDYSKTITVDPYQNVPAIESAPANFASDGNGPTNIDVKSLNEALQFKEKDFKTAQEERQESNNSRSDAFFYLRKFDNSKNANAFLQAVQRAKMNSSRSQSDALQIKLELINKNIPSLQNAQTNLLGQIFSNGNSTTLGEMATKNLADATAVIQALHTFVRRDLTDIGVNLNAKLTSLGTDLDRFSDHLNQEFENLSDQAKNLFQSSDGSSGGVVKVKQETDELLAFTMSIKQEMQQLETSLKQTVATSSISSHQELQEILNKLTAQKNLLESLKQDQTSIQTQVNERTNALYEIIKQTYASFKKSNESAEAKQQYALELQQLEGKLAVEFQKLQAILDTQSSQVRTMNQEMETKLKSEFNSLQASIVPRSAMRDDMKETTEFIYGELHNDQKIVMAAVEALRTDFRTYSSRLAENTTQQNAMTQEFLFNAIRQQVGEIPVRLSEQNLFSNRLALQIEQLGRNISDSFANISSVIRTRDDSLDAVQGVIIEQSRLRLNISQTLIDEMLREFASLKETIDQATELLRTSLIMVSQSFSLKETNEEHKRKLLEFEEGGENFFRITTEEIDKISAMINSLTDGQSNLVDLSNLPFQNILNYIIDFKKKVIQNSALSSTKMNEFNQELSRLEDIRAITYQPGQLEHRGGAGSLSERFFGPTKYSGILKPPALMSLEVPKRSGTGSDDKSSDKFYDNLDSHVENLKTVNESRLMTSFLSNKQSDDLVMRVISQGVKLEKILRYAQVIDEKFDVDKRTFPSLGKYGHSLQVAVSRIRSAFYLRCLIDWFKRVQE